MKVLVTGGTGFVGSWVARELASRGHALRLLVRPRSCLDNIRDIPEERSVGDITAAASVDRAIAGCEAVIHAAAVARLRAGDRDNLLAVNEGGTQNVLGAAFHAGVRRAVGRCIRSGTTGLRRWRGRRALRPRLQRPRSFIHTISALNLGWFLMELRSVSCSRLKER